MRHESQYISGEYLNKNPSFHVEDSLWKAQYVHSILKSNALSPLSVCEVGCGAGDILSQLRRIDSHIQYLHGYEISPQAYQLCLKRTEDTVSFYQEDLTKKTDTHYELVLCMDVIEHIENYFSFIDDLGSYGDYFVFHIPLDMNVQMLTRLKPIERVRTQVGHLHYFTKYTALAALCDKGFEILDWLYTPSGIDRATSIKQKIGRLPRKIMYRIHPDFAVRLLGGYSLLVLAVGPDYVADPEESS